MALLLDLEPPSSPKRQEEKNQNNRIRDKFHKLTSKFSDFWTTLVFFVGQLGKFPLIVTNAYKQNSKYLPHFAILFLVITVSASNITESAKAKSLLSGLISPNPDEEFAVTTEADRFTPLIRNDSAILDKFLNAQTNTDGFAINIAPIDTQITARVEPLPDNSIQDVFYLVRGGDTLSGIAKKFDTKLATLKYINNIDSVNSIRPGVQLKISKKGYEVSATLIAKREAEKSAKLALANRNTVAREQTNNTARITNNNPGSIKNAYPYGWCTYYVATKRYVPGNWGNARTWLSSAQRDGYPTGRTPAAGAIMVSNESRLGHVSYVEKVNDDGSFVITEMNAKGWGVKSARTVSAGYGKIMGFVY